VPKIIITADLEGGVGFSYGFNVTVSVAGKSFVADTREQVPDNSQVLIRFPTSMNLR
jgi:hypothetical protein